MPVSSACRRFGRALRLVHKNQRTLSSVLSAPRPPTPPLPHSPPAPPRTLVLKPGRTCPSFAARANSDARTAKAGARNATCNHRRDSGVPAQIYDPEADLVISPPRRHKKHDEPGEPSVALQSSCMHSGRLIPRRAFLPPHHLAIPASFSIRASITMRPRQSCGSDRPSPRPASAAL